MIICTHWLRYYQFDPTLELPHPASIRKSSRTSSWGDCEEQERYDQQEKARREQVEKKEKRYRQERARADSASKPCENSPPLVSVLVVDRSLVLGSELLDVLVEVRVLSEKSSLPEDGDVLGQSLLGGEAEQGESETQTISSSLALKEDHKKKAELTHLHRGTSAPWRFLREGSSA